MKSTTFFVRFDVIPTAHNPNFSFAEGAIAACWIVDDDPIAAEARARFFVCKAEWTITGVAKSLTEVSEADFEDRDVGLAQYRAAQVSGIAIFYICWPREGMSVDDQPGDQDPKLFNLNSYLKRKKALAKTGRCLHFDSGSQCGQYINAHSIQKSGQLSSIADDGHIYALSMSISDLRDNNGGVSLVKHGIGNISTFPGFCDKHDNELFEPIDKSVLIPTLDQVALYAYRSISRELFVKENALSLIEHQLHEIPPGSALRSTFETMKSGTLFSLSGLKKHKSKFDKTIRDGSYQDVEYVLFTSKQPQFVAFSGLFCPEFDFLGQPLQNLLDPTCRYDLITFCSAPTRDGWGFLFAWHKSSATTCRSFMGSLAEVTYGKLSLGADAMFRLVVSNCENTAFAPSWWEQQPQENKDAVIQCLSRGVDMMRPIDTAYLTHGAEGVSQWEFDAVYVQHE